MPLTLYILYVDGIASSKAVSRGVTWREVGKYEERNIGTHYNRIEFDDIGILLVPEKFWSWTR